MAANLITYGTGAASSNEFTIAAGASLTISLKRPSLVSRVLLQLKDDEGNFHTVGELDQKNPSGLVSSSGIYRVTRVDNGGKCGVFSG